MSDERWQRLRTLFDQVQELPEAERAAFLDRELLGDRELRAELDSLLAASAAAAGFLADRETPATGAMVGPYRLQEPLGEGGFGVVFAAEQLQPIRRRVALKLIKPGMDTRQVIARFEMERQVLALMDHPGIAHVFDAGETAAGRPYFAMEYVPGDPLTTFCDQERLPLRERLWLFLQVCDAIHHAHQKGVLHRDIKPSNVLVARRDGRPALKVIDFGIARATGASVVDERTLTQTGMALGTVGYMSPEQLGSVEGSVDTRADIYSLGVVLYELLAGELPFDRARLRRASWTEVVRLIREETPPPPAVRAARGNTAEVAARRSTDPRSLVRALTGELGWIALRALEKEPDRRYSSASELAADIRRYLSNEPVLAAAPSTAYRLRKYARRHRVGVTAAVFVLLALLGGGIAAGIGLRRAVLAERSARREAEASRLVADFLVELFHASSPDQAKGEIVSARTLLDEGTRRIEARKIADPHVRARLLGAMGDSYLNLGAFDEGVRLTRASLAATEAARPPDALEVARHLDKLANAFSMSGQTDSIPTLADRAITLLRGSPQGDAGLLSMCYYRKGKWYLNRGDLATADSLTTLALRTAESRPVTDSLALQRIYSTKGTIAEWRYQLPEAERCLLRALELAEQTHEPTRAVGALTALAELYSSMDEPEKAVSFAQRGVDRARQFYAPDHPNLAIALSGLTIALNNQERYPEAIVVEEEAVRIVRTRGKPENLGYELNLLGTLYRSVGRLDRAIAVTAEACDVYSRSLGADHFRTAEVLTNLARCHADAGHARQADSLFCRAIGLLDRIADQSILPPVTWKDYADFCRQTGRVARADSFYTRAEATFDSTSDGMRTFLGESLIGHARLRSGQGRHAEAERMIATGFRFKRGDAGADAAELGPVYLAWAGVRARAGDATGAIDRLRCAARCGMKQKDAADYPDLAALRSRADYPFDKSP